MSKWSYHSAWETTIECAHKRKERDSEGNFVWVSTWQKYNVERYHGKVERCYLCKQKRVMDLSGSEVTYIEQASLFS